MTGIFYLERPEGADYDETQSVVVVANSADEARDFAANACGDEGRDAWYSVNLIVRCIGTTAAGRITGVICRDFNAG